MLIDKDNLLSKDYENIRSIMRHVIDAEKLCTPEDEEHKPKVAAAIEKDGNLLAIARRGEIGKGDHAEFTLLQKKLLDVDLTGATLFTTLEPCTSRKSKTPCAEWIIKRGIKKVYIGMLDPNPVILGKGFEMLRNGGVEVLYFPPEFTKEIEDDNSDFINYCKLLNKEEIKSLEDLPYHISPHYRTLDDWYFIINRIYFDKNFSKDTHLIFAHLVEILGGLSVLYTNKNKNIDPKQQIAKALAWWLVLCGKMGIRSIEDMLFYKFPNVCPYCQENPHNDDKCIKIKASNNNPDWQALLKIGKEKSLQRPTTLASWQQMFYKIYPVTQNDEYDKVLGRFTEEIGELAESLRVFKISPTYFLSEASDVFAWLMHLCNLFESRHTPLIEVENRGRFLEKTLFDLYPDKCKDCDQLICACPPVLKSTVGRITNDGPNLNYFDEGNNPYMTKNEIATQFDFGSESIIIGGNEFEVTPIFIKTIYNFSKDLVREIRFSRIENTKYDHIVDSLHNIIAFATTQRVNQSSIDRLLKRIIDLNKEEKQNFLSVINKMKNSNWKSAIENYLK